MNVSIRLILALLCLSILAVVPVAAQDEMTEVTLFATLNPADLANDAIVSISSDLSALTPEVLNFSGDITSLESLDFTTDGVAYITFDAADGAGGVIALNSDMSMGQPIFGASTGLMAPKGLEIIDSMGIVAVANFGANNILLFPLDASGDVRPARIIGTGRVGGSVWDVAYDETTDTLYAAGTTGFVLAYDDFSVDMGGLTPDRTFAPGNVVNAKASVNLHGVHYIADSDTLIVSDVGSADSATDGHLYVIPNASTAESTVPVSVHVLGALSLLGNPVDIYWDGSGLYVAEKANDAILYFADLLSNSGMMDVAPTAVLAATKPESLAALQTAPMTSSGMDDSMMMTAALGDSAIYATGNPDGLDNDQIAGLNADLSATGVAVTGFSDITSIQSATFDANGNAYLTVDVSDGVGNLVSIDAATGEVSAFVSAGNTELVAPKGLEVIDSLNLVVVANFGANNIRGYALGAVNSVPTVAINDFGGVEGSIWDVAYDESSDTLFAAGTTGTLFVYSNFSANLGSTGPSRTIVPADGDGNQISVNLHGVDYDAETDTLFLSDVGAADSPTDGQLFVITQSSFAAGNTPVAAVISGDRTMLGNPVDIVFDNGSLYVAEKANDALLRYDDIITLRGSANTAANVVVEFVKPESISVR